MKGQVLVDFVVKFFSRREMERVSCGGSPVKGICGWCV